jgi:hypothetical protein
MDLGKLSHPSFVLRHLSQLMKVGRFELIRLESLESRREKQI